MADSSDQAAQPVPPHSPSDASASPAGAPTSSAASSEEADTSTSTATTTAAASGDLAAARLALARSHAVTERLRASTARWQNRSEEAARRREQLEALRSQQGRALQAQAEANERLEWALARERAAMAALNAHRVTMAALDVPEHESHNHQQQTQQQPAAAVVRGRSRSPPPRVLSLEAEQQSSASSVSRGPQEAAPEQLQDLSSAVSQQQGHRQQQHSPPESMRTDTRPAQSRFGHGISWEQRMRAMAQLGTRNAPLPAQQERRGPYDLYSPDATFDPFLPGHETFSADPRADPFPAEHSSRAQHSPAVSMRELMDRFEAAAPSRRPPRHPSPPRGTSGADAAGGGPAATSPAAASASAARRVMRLRLEAQRLRAAHGLLRTAQASSDLGRGGSPYQVGEGVGGGGAPTSVAALRAYATAATAARRALPTGTSTPDSSSVLTAVTWTHTPVRVPETAASIALARQLARDTMLRRAPARQTASPAGATSTSETPTSETSTYGAAAGSWVTPLATPRRAAPGAPPPLSSAQQLRPHQEQELLSSTEGLAALEVWPPLRLHERGERRGGALHAWQQPPAASAVAAVPGWQSDGSESGHSVASDSDGDGAREAAAEAVAAATEAAAAAVGSEDPAQRLEAAIDGIDAEREHIMREIAALHSQQSASMRALLMLRLEQFMVRHQQMTTLIGIVQDLGATFGAAGGAAMPEDIRASLHRISLDVLATLRRLLEFSEDAGLGEASEIYRRTMRYAAEAAGPAGATPEVIGALPLASAGERGVCGAECAICLCAYEAADVLRCLPCGHGAHCACLDKWLGLNASCPECRLAVGGGARALEC